MGGEGRSRATGARAALWLVGLLLVTLAPVPAAGQSPRWVLWKNSWQSIPWEPSHEDRWQTLGVFKSEWDCQAEESQAMSRVLLEMQKRPVRPGTKWTYIERQKGFDAVLDVNVQGYGAATLTQFHRFYCFIATHDPRR